MQFLDAGEFLKDKQDEMFYVGFLKSSKEWFPLCIVSDPEQGTKLDTLVLAHTFPTMSHALEEYKSRVPQLEEVFVQYLMQQEVLNLVDRYALTNVMVLRPGGSDGQCGAGCECGCDCT